MREYQKLSNAVREYSFSPVKTKNDPFLDLKIPGLFNEKEDKSTTIFSYFERRKILNFNYFSRRVLKYPLYECFFKSEKLNQTDLDVFEQIKDKNPYFTIYLDSHKYNVPLIDSTTNQIFTNYLIKINTSKRIKFLAEIVELEPIAPKIGEALKFNFSLMFTKIQNNTTQRSQNSKYYLLFSCVLFTVVTLVNRIIKKQLKNSPLPIPNVEIWRIPNTIDKLTTMWNIGILIFTLICILIAGKIAGGNPGNIILQSFIFSPYLANAFLSYWDNVMQQVAPLQYVIPSYIVLVCAWLPYQILTLVTNKVYGTFRGPMLKDEIIQNAIVFSIQYFMSFFVGLYTKLLSPSVRIKTDTYDFRNNQKRSKPLRLYVYYILFGIFLVICLFPALKNMFIDYMIHAEKLDKMTISAAIICAFALISLISHLATYQILKHSVGISWLEGYTFRSLLPSILFFIICMYFTFTEIEGVVSKIYCTYISYLVGFCSFFLIIGLNFTITFSFMLVTGGPQIIRKVE